VTKMRRPLAWVCHRVVPSLASLLLATGGAAAQPPVRPPTSAVEADPLTCWWRTSAAAVMAGERFTVTLTCSLYESDRDKVNVDASQFDATALALSPFEVVSGRRHEEVVAGSRRHVQYEYVVRHLGSGSFGQDVDLPSLSIKYRVQSSIGGTEGRELTYVLPPLSMRLLSLVPPKTTDIREWTHGAFAELAERRRRANLWFIGAAVAFAFALALIGLAIVHLIGGYRARRPVGPRVFGPPTLLGGCVSDLGRLGDDVARGGWTTERMARALAGFRVASAVALGRAVAQAPLDDTTPIREGQVPFRSGVLRGTKMVMSASASAPAIERRRPARGLGARQVEECLTTLARSLQVFTAARYAPAGDVDQAAIDEAWQAGLRATRRLRWLAIGPLRARGTRSPKVQGTGAPLWTR